MAYVYEVRFQISPEHISDLRIGASIERILGFLKAFLPGEPGYMTARAMHTLPQAGSAENVMVVVESTWEYWEDVQRHIRAGHTEEKALTEFSGYLTAQDLMTTVYQEVD